MIRTASNRIVLYGAEWPGNSDPLSIERECIRRNGKWQRRNGQMAGNGLFYHYRKFQELLWPEKIWEKGPFKNHWAEKCLEAYLAYTYIGVLGAAGSGKSDSFGSNVLTDWYCFPECTTVLVSSTELKSLELRIWGMIKRYHRAAKEKFPWLPGYLIEGKQMLVEHPKDEAREGRDFKNGILGIAARRGTAYVGISSYVGIHNKRVRLLADECNLMPRAFLDSVANLAKCEDFKLVGLGNPNETTNAHGVLCEPHPDDGGWESGIDQEPGTKMWRTRFPNGIALQLPGSDSPNMKIEDGQPAPFPFLITRKQMQDDAQIWGVDDWHYTMMNESRMPRGQGSRRVLTRQDCVKFGAFSKPEWRDHSRTSITFLDAAYKGVGGDRCVFGELQFGSQATPIGGSEVLSSIITQGVKPAEYRQILSLIDLVIIPIKSERGAESPEDQIVNFVRNEHERRGIPPENFFYDAGMRTSLVQAFSRNWSAAVNSIDSMGKPSEEKVSAEIDKPCHEYYSKFVTELWYSVRLVVVSSQFRGMTEELCTELSTREWKMVTGNRIELESKEDMKKKLGRSPDCFVAGTLIRTPTGNVPIEKIQVGDLVDTPFGSSPVIKIHEQETSYLTKVHFSDGSSLEGKPNHKVFVWGKGWVKLKDLLLTDHVETDTFHKVWHLLNHFYTRETGITFKALVDTISAEKGQPATRRDFYTGSFGTIIKDRLKKAWRSITKMATDATTAFQISNWNLFQNIVAGTCASGSSLQCIGQKTDWTCEKQSLLHQHGIDHLMVENGIPIIPKTNGRTESQIVINVSSAGRISFGLRSKKTSSSVQQNARQSTTGRSMLRTAIAFAVELVSRLINGNQLKTVPVDVRHLVSGNPETVFNLTLLEHNAYYANGILVDNCADAVAYGIYGARRKGFVISRAPQMRRLERGSRRDWRDEIRDKARESWSSGTLNYAV